MRPTKAVSAALCVCGLLYWGPVTAAQDSEPKSTYWQHDPTERGRWFDPANWSAGTPGPGTYTYVDNGGTAVIYDLAIVGAGDGSVVGWAEASMLYVGDGRGGGVEQIGGVLSVTSDVYLSRYGGPAGTYDLDDGWLLAQNVYIGSGRWWDPATDLACGGTFRQTGGSCWIGQDATTGGSLYVGYRAQPPILSDGDGAAAPYVADRGGALYELAGGDLSAGRTYVGQDGTGKFVQSGGTNWVGHDLLVSGTGWGCVSGGFGECPTEGTYVLDGGYLAAGSARVGHRGRGQFFQNGGTALVAGKLQVGADWSWWIVDCIIPADGYYVLTDGTLSTGGTDVGVGGVGEFVQSGGSHDVAGVLRIGGHPECPIPWGADGASGSPAAAPGDGQDGESSWWPPGPPRGSYAMQGGSLWADRLEVGPGLWAADVCSDGTLCPPGATFVQTGGTVHAAAVSVCAGRYEMRAGSLATGSLSLTGPSAWGSAQFLQGGGSCAVDGPLHVGTAPRAIHVPQAGVDPAGNAAFWPGAQYTLAGGELACGWAYVGAGGPGRFLQTGGTHEVAYDLHVGAGLYAIADATREPADDSLPQPWCAAEGTYELVDGELYAASVHVGQRGRGIVHQSGGSVAVESFLQVGGNWWWWCDAAGSVTGDAAAGEMSSVLPPERWLASNGTYVLRGGELAAGHVEVGVGGTGRFVQSGGHHEIAGVLRVGGHPWWILANTAGGTSAVMPPWPGPGSGQYTLSGGSVSAGAIDIAGGYTPWPWEPTDSDPTSGSPCAGSDPNSSSA